MCGEEREGERGEEREEERERGREREEERERVWIAGPLLGLVADCSESHRPHRNDSNKFQVRHNNVWWDQVCQTGLVWNQTLCR